MRLDSKDVTKVMAGLKVTHRIPAELDHQVQVREIVELRSGAADTVRAHILITGLRRQDLHRLTDEEAINEGFEDRADFMAHWQHVHGRVEPDAAVWVVAFRPVRPHRPRLVRRGAGYTSSPKQAITGEPEAVPEHYCIPRAPAGYTPDVEIMQLEELAVLMKAQLKAMRKVAAKTGTDITADIGAMQRRVRSIESKITAARRAA